MGVFKFLFLFSIMMLLLGSGEQHLLQNFYSSTCPDVEAIVREALTTKLQQSFITIPATLRLFFHDCFVEGCDASIMISSPNHDAEKDASDNLSLAGDGFDAIIKAKQAVESVCPGVVSCADIIAIAARDVVALSGGPSFGVELGRRDGLISKASRVAGNLPEPDSDLKLLSSLFSKHNLTQTDMVALSGAHTLGVTNCKRIVKRLYDFNSSTRTDPSLDRAFAEQLKKTCPQKTNKEHFTDLDLQTPTSFDLHYFENLQVGRGVFSTDQVLYEDLETRATVHKFASSATSFNEAFAAAMIKLGRVGVKVGDQGEVRSNCEAFNSP